MMTPLVLICLGVLTRVVPHPPNAVALGAVALFAGAKLPRAWAWLVPILAMVGSDLILDWGTGRGVFDLSRVSIYAAYAAIALLGRLGRRAHGVTAPLSLGALSLAGSGLFFLATNLAVWASDAPRLYPLTIAGLAECYVQAVPFVGNTVLADLSGVAILFGFDAIARRVAEGRKAPIAEPARADLIDA